MGTEDEPADPTSEQARVAALAYARRGWSVVPLHAVAGGRCSCGDRRCASPGKHPRVRWEDHQRSGAAEARVRAWWDRWPGANVGIVTGSVSGLVVVDVDPRHDGGATLAELEARYGTLPASPTVLTGGGGQHRYLAHPGRAVPSGPIGPGLDVKADGGLVVAPPSRHLAGTRYRWAPGCGPDDRSLGATPVWVVDRAHGPPPVDGSREPSGPPRTRAERDEFTALWAEVGIDLLPGDRYYLCPFHDDTHPSLHVDAEGCRWYCFGCGQGGGPGRLRRLVERSRATTGRDDRAARAEEPVEATTPRAAPVADAEPTPGATPAAAADSPAASGAARPPAPRRPRSVGTHDRQATLPLVPAGEAAPDAIPSTWMQWPVLQPGDVQPVVGEAGHQETLEWAAGGRTWRGAHRPVVTAVLRRERDDADEPGAVRVEIDGRPVGYLPRVDAPRFHTVLDRHEAASVTARAWLTGGWSRGPQGRGWFGVELDVDPRVVEREPGCPFLPPGPPVAVVGEEAHQAPLRDLVGVGHGATVTAELVEERSDDAGSPLAVRIGGEPVGRLGSSNSDRYRPLVRAVAAAGFPTSCGASVIEGGTKLEVYVLLPPADLAERDALRPVGAGGRAAAGG